MVPGVSKSVIVFDYDGVIVDSIEDLAAECSAALGAVGCPPITADHLRGLEHMNYSGVAAIGGVSRPHAVENPEYGRFQEALDAALFRDRPLPRPHPGMAEAVVQLAKRYALAVVTNNVARRVEQTLSHAGVAQHVHLILDATDRRGKAEKILDCAARLGASAGRTYMVGDAVSDLVAAKDAGAYAIAAAWGFQGAERLAPYEPTYCASDFPDLVRWFATRVER